MKWRDFLKENEREELKNMMLHEPVATDKTISPGSANRLWKLGLIRAEQEGWMVNWEIVAKGADGFGA